MYDIRIIEISNGWVVNIEDVEVKYFPDFEDAVAHIVDIAGKEEEKQGKKK